MYIKDYSPNTYHILSKMVCKHQSEWSYSGERIKEDAKAYFKYHYPNYSSSQIQQSLQHIEKVFKTTYDFWNVLTNKLSGQDKTFFKEGVFWYFEPFAWVTQMMKIFKWDFKTEEMDGLLNSPTSVYSF